MLDLRTVPLTDHAKDKIRTKANNHYEISGIMITGAPEMNNEGLKVLDLQVSQLQVLNQKLLSDDELISRCTSIFEDHLPEGFVLRISAIPVEK